MSKEFLFSKKMLESLSRLTGFAHDQVIASILLLLSTGIALIWANSDYSDSYFNFFTTELGLYFDEYSSHLSLSIEAWISEGLMALFFFFLGLEIKREILVGELREFRQSLPILFAAAGGILCPALFYFLCNFGSGNGAQGWGIPMATDTAFAIGVLALLGSRVPSGLIVFVTALAIVDDIAAMLVIAFAYSDEIFIQAIVWALCATGGLYIANKCGVRSAWFYFLGGVVIWLFLHEAGIHTTIAGVLVALTIPTSTKTGAGKFISRTRYLLKRFKHMKEFKRGKDSFNDREQHEVLSEIAEHAQKATTPLRRWENILEKPVTLLVMPLFALANAGIIFSKESLVLFFQDFVSIGIFTGLVLGKPLGIIGMTYLAIKLKFGSLPKNVNFHHVIGAGLLAGIGFTMSLLIATLAFQNTPETHIVSKGAIIVSSLTAGLLGYCWLRFAPSSISHRNNQHNLYPG